MYRSTKTFGHDLGLSACFRQWQADSHCSKIHGYALSIKLTFETSELDKNGWVVDFGSFSDIKDFLKKTFDHKLLVARDDPYLSQFIKLEALELADIVIVDRTGCEAFAKLIYDEVVKWLLTSTSSASTIVTEVEVREHGANSAIYSGEKCESN